MRNVVSLLPDGFAGPVSSPGIGNFSPVPYPTAVNDSVCVGLLTLLIRFDK
jgi:hypothetical protein